MCAAGGVRGGRAARGTPGPHRRAHQPLLQVSYYTFSTHTFQGHLIKLKLFLDSCYKYFIISYMFLVSSLKPSPFPAAFVTWAVLDTGQAHPK